MMIMAQHLMLSIGKRIKLEMMITKFLNIKNFQMQAKILKIVQKMKLPLIQDIPVESKKLAMDLTRNKITVKKLKTA